VKVWRPTPEPCTLNTPHTLGVHGDYVKTLASPGPYASWIASGGLDRKVFLWDLSGKGEVLGIDVGQQAANPQKASIYALAATNSLIAAGGPDSIVRLWDARSGGKVTRFVGHTDMIRSILVAADGETVMTASSDCTVKVWSLTAGRCEYTLTMHSDSVWDLYSEHPQLKLFWSTDITGLVAKTDVRRKTEFDDGVCVAVCQEAEGVSKMIHAGGYIWTGTRKSSLNRWKDVPTEEAEALLADSSSTRYRGSMATLPTRPRVASGSASQYSNTFTDSSPRRDSPAPPQHSPQGATTVSVRNLLRLSATAPFPQRGRDVDTSTLHSSASIRRQPEVSDADEGLQCVRSTPDFTIEGQHGLIKHVMLNNKRMVLTVDTAGEVTMWDLIKVRRAISTDHLTIGRPIADDICSAHR
jgi:WD repeat-containing protein 48